MILKGFSDSDSDLRHEAGLRRVPMNLGSVWGDYAENIVKNLLIRNFSKETLP